MTTIINNKLTDETLSAWKAEAKISMSETAKDAPEYSHHAAIFELVTELQERRKVTAPPAPEDYFSSLVSAARLRADKAMRKFPQPNYVLNKVAEESGEVIKEVIHYTEGRGDWNKVEYELIDNLAMLIRLVTEGDQVIGFTPPDVCRDAKGSQPVSIRDELSSPVIPDGYALVPKEPTEAMLLLLGLTGSFTAMDAAYQKMLAASTLHSATSTDI